MACCHKCEFGKKIARGEAQGLCYADTPCASCDGKVVPEYVVAYDENRPLPDWPEEGGGRRLPVSVLASAVKLILHLRAQSFEVVRLRYMGRRFREIAAIVGCSETMAKKRFFRAMHKHPLLLALFPKAVVGRRTGKKAAAPCAPATTEKREAAKPPALVSAGGQPRESAKRGAAEPGGDPQPPRCGS